MREPAFFDKRGKKRAGDRKDLHPGIDFFKGMLVRTASDRPFGSDDSDRAGLGHLDSPLHSGPDDADDRDIDPLAQERQSDSRDGIASDHDHLERERPRYRAWSLGGVFGLVCPAGVQLGSNGLEETQGFVGVTGDGFFALIAVRNAGGISKVKESF